MQLKLEVLKLQSKFLKLLINTLFVPLSQHVSAYTDIIECVRIVFGETAALYKLS
jgi:hypothetical protein